MLPFIRQDDAAAAGAVLAVAVDDAEAPPAAAAIAPTARVLVRASEDVPGLVGEDTVDVVGTPAVVVVVHDQPRSADAGVGEPCERILGEEPTVRPPCPEPGAEILDVVAATPFQSALNPIAPIAGLRQWASRSGAAGSAAVASVTFWMS